MEEILKQLQAIHVEALKMKVAIFYISTYHWDDTPESPDAIIVRASRTCEGDNVFFGRIYINNIAEALAVISQLKLYLGL